MPLMSAKELEYRSVAEKRGSLRSTRLASPHPGDARLFPQTVFNETDYHSTTDHN